MHLYELPRIGKFIHIHRASQVALLVKKKPFCQCRRHQRCGFNPGVGKIPWRRTWQPPPVFLPGKSYGWRSLVGCSPGGYKELDMTEHTHDTHIESKAVINRGCGRGMKSCLMGTEFLFRKIKKF